MTLILGIGFKARQGKDSAAEALVSYYEHKNNLFAKHELKKKVIVKRFGFADALYEECRVLHGMTTKDAPLLQRVGLERRKEDPNYWISKVFAAINSTRLDVAIIADTRFQNEAAAIKAAGGYTIRVSRLNQDGTPYVADDRPADHPSEIELENYNWDYRIIAKTGESALVGEQAITISEYIRARRS